jgi:hypothetical protein
MRLILLAGIVMLIPVVIYGNHTHNAVVAFSAIAGQCALYLTYIYTKGSKP